MPTKIITETQLLRLLGNTAIKVEITMLRVNTHESVNNQKEHLLAFYQSLNDVRCQRFDGLIISGAPVEHLRFEEMDYWEELKEIMDWALENLFSLFYICWGAQAALFHQFGILKHSLNKKQFGVFSQRVMEKNIKLLRVFDDIFYVPHSRHTETRRRDVEKLPGLTILAESEQAWVYLIATREGRQVFATGHSEYDPLII